MRIAVSGTHLVGKTSLAEALSGHLPQHAVMPEPYYLLEEDGYEFAGMPSLEDFEAQLTRSFQAVEESGDQAIFDRCPLDVLGYLLTHADAHAFTLEDWMPQLRTSVSRLDCIVFVPIENPDRIAVPRSQARLRADVDTVLQEIVLDDVYGLDLQVITVAGTPAARVSQVMTRLRSVRHRRGT
jgi:hypothetical protein